MIDTVIHVCREEVQKALRGAKQLYEVAADMDARALYVLAMIFRDR